MLTVLSIIVVILLLTGGGSATATPAGIETVLAGVNRLIKA